MIELKKMWEQLSPRDQKAALIGGFSLAVILFYFIIINPLSNKVKVLKTNIVDSQELLSWMNEASEQVKQSHISSGNDMDKNISLLSLIEKSTKSSQLAASVSEIKQLDDNEVQLKFKTIVFDQLIAWLKNIQNKNRVYVNKITLRRTETDGVVQGDMVLVRS